MCYLKMGPGQTNTYKKVVFAIEVIVWGPKVDSTCMPTCSFWISPLWATNEAVTHLLKISAATVRNCTVYGSTVPYVNETLLLINTDPL